MLDLKFIRENANLVMEAVANRQDTAPVDEILKLDSERRRKVLELESLRSERKKTAREKNIEAGRGLRTTIRALEAEVRNLDEQLKMFLLQVPNIPQPDVPVGKGEEDNVAVRSGKEPKTFDFKPAPHWKLGESLDIIDFDRGVKLSGTRFYVLKGMGARLQRALISFMLDLHTREHTAIRRYTPPIWSRGKA